MPTAMMLTAPPGELTGKDLTPGPGSSIIFAAAAIISKLFNPARLPARPGKQPRLRSQHQRTGSRALAPAPAQQGPGQAVPPAQGAMPARPARPSSASSRACLKMPPCAAGPLKYGVLSLRT